MVVNWETHQLNVISTISLVVKAKFLLLGSLIESQIYSHQFLYKECNGKISLYRSFWEDGEKATLTLPSTRP